MNRITTFLQVIRIKQWIKNLLIYVPIIFTQDLLNLTQHIKCIEGFISFSILASSIYILNDIRDRKRDAIHPINKSRPITQGIIKLDFAYLLFGIFAITSLILSYLINKWFYLFCSIYFMLNILYIFIVRNIIIIDVLVIAANFTIRVLCGLIILEREMSRWLFISIPLLSIFVSFCKRYVEIKFLSENTIIYRKSLSLYNKKLLQLFIAIFSILTITSYITYTMSETTLQKYGGYKMMLTIPPVLFGIFRYMSLILKSNSFITIEDIILKDLPFIFNMCIYLITCILLIHVL